jgi:hypothetical protein
MNITILPKIATQIPREGQFSVAAMLVPQGTTLTLQDKLDELRAKAKADMPVQLNDVIENELKKLVSSGQAERAMKAGDLAPSFRLPDTTGKMVESASLVNRRGIRTPFRG